MTYLNDLWRFLEALSKINLLGGTWNFVGVIFAICIFLFTERKLGSEYSPKKSLVLSLTAVLFMMGFWDSLNSVAAYVQPHPAMPMPPGNWILTVLSQWAISNYWILFLSATVIWLTFGKRLRLSWLSVIALGYFALNMVFAVLFNTGAWRSLPDPQQTIYWLVFYIPAYLAQTLFYIGLWIPRRNAGQASQDV